MSSNNDRNISCYCRGLCFCCTSKFSLRLQQLPPLCTVIVSALQSVFRPSQTGDSCLYHHVLVHMLGINQNRFAEGGRGGQWPHQVAVARAITSLGREELESRRQAQQCPSRDCHPPAGFVIGHSDHFCHGHGHQSCGTASKRHPRHCPCCSSLTIPASSSGPGMAESIGSIGHKFRDWHYQGSTLAVRLLHRSFMSRIFQDCGSSSPECTYVVHSI